MVSEFRSTMAGFRGAGGRVRGRGASFGRTLKVSGRRRSRIIGLVSSCRSSASTVRRCRRTVGGYRRRLGGFTSLFNRLSTGRRGTGRTRVGERGSELRGSRSSRECAREIMRTGVGGGANGGVASTMGTGGGVGTKVSTMRNKGVTGTTATLGGVGTGPCMVTIRVLMGTIRFNVKGTARCVGINCRGRLGCVRATARMALGNLGSDFSA